ncbi:Adenylate kinase [Candidatus Koribacter versatilis Ellin345]|uniref:Adenylate kinase n=1 Tax=Koribacter versatilis (strain Ellin345) TaxID=204669 RepID=Q1ILN6_KORVE|nr:nucleoside monophosphate kinase [Candidatus Koribacter versatilis]ABF42214.1 Adenylate kinase [Candidatus Koribacter versatilis Ellin345]
MATETTNHRAAWLQGPSAKCETPTCTEQAWRLVLLGAPGVGKGTQAELLNEQLHACHLSTGDVFRAASKSAGQLSPAMKAASDFMRKGELVPDSTVWEMVRERKECLHCVGGFILDGFPRTLGQAESLARLMKEEGISLHAVINYDLPATEIVARLSGRRTCEGCKAVYNVIERPPKTEGLCDKCGGALFQREDDKPESIKVRLDAYDKLTSPLIDFYKKLGALVSVDAHGTPAEICDRTILALQLKTAK